MGFKQVVKNSLVRGFNVKRWLGVDAIKRDTAVVKSIVQHVFHPNEPGKTEGETDEKGRPVHKTFADYVSAYGLTEADLERRMKQLRWMAYFCAFLGLSTLVYAFVLWMHYDQILNGFVCVSDPLYQRSLYLYFLRWLIEPHHK